MINLSFINDAHGTVHFRTLLRNLERNKADEFFFGRLNSSLANDTYGNEQLCPVRALKHWLDASGIIEGPIFRRIYLNNHIAEEPLVPLSVSNILRKWADAAEIPEAKNLSSHSLRRGLATAASRDGASLSAIMRQGRWKNVNTVMEYIEAAQRFEENAAGSVLSKL